MFIRQEKRVNLCVYISDVLAVAAQYLYFTLPLN
jgi:hypothetical protein